LIKPATDIGIAQNDKRACSIHYISAVQNDGVGGTMTEVPHLKVIKSRLDLTVVDAAQSYDPREGQGIARSHRSRQLLGRRSQLHQSKGELSWEKAPDTL
jgi:hypothetical protein